MLTNKSLCVVLELCQSYEIWHWIICTPVVLALSYLLSLLCSLILSIHFTFLQHFTSSKSGIISCTWRCYQGSRIFGKDKTKTDIWENKPLTQRMLLFHPSAVPHLSRLQPPLGFLDMLIVKSMKMNTTLSRGTSRASRMTWGYLSSFQSTRSTWKNT